MPNSFQPIFRRSTLVCFCARSSLSSSSPPPSSGSPPRSVGLLVRFASSLGSPPCPVCLLVRFACSSGSLLVRFASSSGSPSPSSGSPSPSSGSPSPLSSSPTSPVLLERSLCSQTVRFLSLMGASSYVLFISLPPTTGSLPRPPRLLPHPVPFATGSSSPVRPPPVCLPVRFASCPVRFLVRFATSSG